jgi:hypothetical protein
MRFVRPFLLRVAVLLPALILAVLPAPSQATEFCEQDAFRFPVAGVDHVPRLWTFYLVFRLSDDGWVHFSGYDVFEERVGDHPRPLRVTGESFQGLAWCNGRFDTWLYTSDPRFPVTLRRLWQSDQALPWREWVREAAQDAAASPSGRDFALEMTRAQDLCVCRFARTAEPYPW